MPFCLLQNSFTAYLSVFMKKINKIIFGIKFEKRKIKNKLKGGKNHELSKI